MTAQGTVAQAATGAGLSVSAPAVAAPAGASAAVGVPARPRPPVPPAAPSGPASPDGPGVSVQIDGEGAGRSQAVTIIVLMTVLSVAPALLLLMTSFTKIVIVLGLTRQAMGTPTIPPNQVIVGIALFLSLFVMGGVVKDVNDQAIQPYLSGRVTMTQAFDRGEAPLRTFMLRQTGRQELQTMITLSKSPQPARREDVSFTTLLPAFVLSELKSAFIIGFVIFIPFLVIDLVVASVLMSMGMMMLPPVMISLPFKILLFIMVDGWSLITTALVASYQQGG
ncbi:flagellar type III secretion system pore protein FliP [Gephyromycinifex aptenodytis]|uniref:flagellar type III secretion system pore protein FliP n=1 Tax=Gephyromycinifex aptenodytis TaxID=2716227 RepID=UPI0014485898